VPCQQVESHVKEEEKAEHDEERVLHEERQHAQNHRDGQEQIQAVIVFRVLEGADEDNKPSM